MITECCVCGEVIELPKSEFLKVEQSVDDDYICPHCTEEAKKFAREYKLRLN